MRRSRVVTFCVVVQRMGRFFSALMPFCDGPRHWGQFSAAGATTSPQTTTVAIISCLSMLCVGRTLS